jgi:hypothetical protein
LGGVAERVGAVDDHPDSTGVEERGERLQVLSIDHVLDELDVGRASSHERGARHSRKGGGQSAAVPDAVRHERPSGTQRTDGRFGRVVHHVVEDHVVAATGLCEVLLGVVDDVIDTEGLDELTTTGAAHAGHLGAERLGDLDGERPHPS